MKAGGKPVMAPCWIWCALFKTLAGSENLTGLFVYLQLPDGLSGLTPTGLTKDQLNVD